MFVLSSAVIFFLLIDVNIALAATLLFPLRVNTEKEPRLTRDLMLGFDSLPKRNIPCPSQVFVVPVGHITHFQLYPHHIFLTPHKQLFTHL